MAEQIFEPGNMQVALTALGQEFAAGAAARMRRFDQLAEDAASMWASALVSPTVMTGMGYRTMTESGSSRTRAETNNPPNTAAPGAPP